MASIHVVIEDKQTNGFSAHTTLDGIFTDLLDDRTSCQETDEEVREVLDTYDVGTDEGKRALVTEYEYVIHEATPENIAKWEKYHGYKWKEWTK